MNSGDFGGCFPGFPVKFRPGRYTERKGEGESGLLQCGSRVILVGTKVDLRADKGILQRLQERGCEPVSRRAGKELAEEIHAYTFLEVSIHADDTSELLGAFEKALSAALYAKESKKRKAPSCILL